MNLNIRPARPGDAERIAEFNRLLAKETEAKELDRELLTAGVAAMLADPRKGRYYVAEAKDEMVGQLGVTCEWSDWRNGNFWWIQSVYVAKPARRLGVFRALYEHLLLAARRELDVIGVRLYVEHDNQVAQVTYKKMGMTMTGYHVMEVYPL
ncbi:MAG: GNAT family N-acetyltransferase [Planctomycetes bacterium]|nr:GNAT family N-acetyltransferase [Planctomycetota bacterium]